MSELGIFEDHGKRFISALRAATLFTSKYEVLPEVLEIFGEDDFIRFLEIFGGRVVTVPRVEEVNRVLRDIAVWVSLSHPDEAERKRRELWLVQEFGLTRTRLRKIYAAVSDSMVNVGLSLRAKNGENV